MSHKLNINESRTWCAHSTTTSVPRGGALSSTTRGQSLPRTDSSSGDLYIQCVVQCVVQCVMQCVLQGALQCVLKCILQCVLQCVLQCAFPGCSGPINMYIYICGMHTWNPYIYVLIHAYPCIHLYTSMYTYIWIPYLHRCKNGIRTAMYIYTYLYIYAYI